MAPLVQNQVTIYCGDCREVLRLLPAGSVHTCVTSPPYWALRDYGVAGQLGLERIPDCLGWATGAPCGECYVCRLVAAFREVHRVLRDDGTLWLNMGDTYAGYWGKKYAHKPFGDDRTPDSSTPPSKPSLDFRDSLIKPKDLIGIPWRVALALQVDGWYLRSDVIWSKRNPMPESVTDRPTRAHEYVFLLTKSRQYFYDADAVKEPLAKSNSQRTTSHYLDADNVPVRDPAFLFDTPQYAQHGTILWPDYGRLSPERAAWRVFGNIPYRDEPEVESGQIVIDKARCWRALTFANWCGERSAFFFAHVHGDKELFHLCWRKLGQEYAMPSRGIHTLAGTMCQHDFEDHRLFQHRNGRKWSLYDNPQVPGFQFEAECLRYIAELKNVWSPAAQTLATDADRAATAALNGRRFEYNRIGYDHRPMVFRGDGTISVGGAGCERYWTIRDGRLLIAGDDGRLTMDLTLAADGGWEGRWLVYEKMGIRMELKM
jgi:DNA modification methylase